MVEVKKEIFVSSTRREQLIDITLKVNKVVSGSKVKNGLCTVFVPHATAGIIINESADPEIEHDILKALSKMVPEHETWKHDRIDNNAVAHIKASIIGPSVTIPIKNGELQLGSWQDIFVADFDGPRKRKVIVAIFE